MMNELDQKEFEAVLKLNAEYRQDYCLRHIRESGELYILLQNEGPLLLSDNETLEEADKAVVLPVWSHAKFAEIYMDNNKLTDTLIQKVSIEAFTQHWVPMLIEQHIMLGFLPLDDDSDFMIDEAGKISNEIQA